MTIPTISTLPTAPARTDPPATFVTRADSFLAALVVMQGELNTSIGAMNTDIAQVNTDATTASNAATSAAASASAAIVTANASIWVSGQSYDAGDNVISPTDYQTYRATTATSGTTDPQSSGDWVIISNAIPSQTGQSGKYLTTDGNTASWGAVSTTIGSLDKTFTSAEEYLLTLSNALTEVPVVSALIEESGTDAISNSWMVDNSLYNFEREDFAPAVDLTISSATTNGVYTVSSGSLSSYIGMMVEGNGGKAIIRSSSKYEIVEPFKNTDIMSSGEWSLYGISYLSKNLQTITNNGNPYLEALTNVTFSSSADIQSAVSSNLSGTNVIKFSPDGLIFFYALGSRIYSIELPAPYNISAIDNTLLATRKELIGIALAEDFIFNNDGTKLYAMESGTGSELQSWTLTSPYDLDTATKTAFIALNTSQCIFLNDEETIIYVYEASNDVFQARLLDSSGDITSELSGVYFTPFAQNPESATKLANGNIFISSNAGYTLMTPNFEVLEHTLLNGLVDGENLRESTVSYNGDMVFMFHEGNDIVYGIKVGQENNETYYHAITSGSLDTQYWTNIDTVTSIDNDNGLTSVLSYAISTDEQDTFYVNAWRAGGYQRNIVRNNAGTWQYNSNTDYNSETWTNASSNDKFQAFNQAYGVTGDVGHYLDNFTFVTSELINGTDSAPRDVFMREDGLKFWMVGSTGDNVYQFDLAAAHNFTTITYSGNSFSISGQATTPYGLALSTDGLKMYVSETGNINQYTLSTAWDITTASFDGTHTGSIAFNFSNDGKYYYTINYSTDLVAVYELDTPWDTQGTTTLLSSQDITSPIGSPYGIYITPNGKELWVTDTGADGIYKFNLKTAWDVSSSSLDKSIYKFISYNTATTSTTYGINVSGAGKYLYFGNGFEIFQNTINETGSISGSGFLNTSNITLGDNLDVAVSLYSDNQTAEFGGVQIQYDAAASNRAAALGVDYTYDVPETGKVRLKSLKDANFKFRVV